MGLILYVVILVIVFSSIEAVLHSQTITPTPLSTPTTPSPSTINSSNTVSSPSITVATDKPSYIYGEKITISGSVVENIGVPLFVTIRNPIGDIVNLNQVDIGNGTTYSAGITTGGGLWQAAGTYTVTVQYGSPDRSAKTTFQFLGHLSNTNPNSTNSSTSNPRIVDSFGNAITGAVKVGQQIQVTADLANGQDRDQPFVCVVQIQDSNGVMVLLSWITGTLTAGQSLNPAQSWTPSTAGTYTAQIFVWQSIVNPNALSPPLSTTITVQ
jgi:hypothetical protein